MPVESIVLAALTTANVQFGHRKYASHRNIASASRRALEQARRACFRRTPPAPLAAPTAPAIVPFSFEGQKIKVLDLDGRPWFVLAGVCRVLGISNVGNASARLDEDERGSIRITDVTSAGGNPNVTIINESGLYSLILTSRKDAAKRFKKWVTAEVLPTIRRTGSYSAVAGAAELEQRFADLEPVPGRAADGSADCAAPWRARAASSPRYSGIEDHLFRVG